MEILLGILVGAFLITLFCMNTMNVFSKKTEGFTSETPKNQLAVQIKAVLDPMVAGAEDLCSVFNTVKSNMIKNEKTGNSISDQEAERRVINALTLKIPGGPLPCPLLQYPKDSSTDIEWLTWLQSVPSDFGARVVLMTMYAKDSLQNASQGLRDALSGKANAATAKTEPFAVCPPDVAATRRAEKAKQGQAQDTCTLPEDAKPEDIQAQITSLLKKLVVNKNQILKENNIDPNISLKPLIQDAKANQQYLEKQGKAAEAGTLEVNIPSRP
jgi:hypothetical protein